MARQVTVAAGYANLTGGYFIPDVYSKKLQAKFYAKCCFDDIANHDWSGEIKGKGSKVIIRARPDITIFDYTVGGTIPYQDLTDSEIELLIDSAKGWAFKSDTIDEHQSDIDYVNECTDDAAFQEKIAIEQDVFQTIYNQMDSGNVMSSTVVTKANVLDWLVDARVLLEENNVPSNDLWAVLPPWICGMIMKSEIKDASLAGDRMSMLRGKGKIESTVGDIAGFNIYCNNNLYTSGGTYYGLAGSPHFFCFASQFTETRIGFDLENTFGKASRGLNVYGFKVTKDTAGVQLPATKS